jgi:hypothetical protein
VNAEAGVALSVHTATTIAAAVGTRILCQAA